MTTPTRLTVDLDRDIHKALKLYALEQNVTMADLVRMLVTRHLADQTPADEVTERETTRQLRDLARSLRRVSERADVLAGTL